MGACLDFVDVPRLVVGAGSHQSARALDGAESLARRGVDQPRGTSAWQSVQPADT